jgi:hypothetical protein
MLLIWVVRIIELVFFTEAAGCVVTIVASWYSILKDEFTSETDVPGRPARLSVAVVALPKKATPRDR